MFNIFDLRYTLPSYFKVTTVEYVSLEAQQWISATNPISVQANLTPSPKWLVVQILKFYYIFKNIDVTTVIFFSEISPSPPPPSNSRTMEPKDGHSDRQTDRIFCKPEKSRNDVSLQTK